MKAPDRVRAASPAREFQSLVDIVIAPVRAFATIEASAPWRAAFAVTVLVDVVSVALVGPAYWHVAFTSDPAAARSTATELATYARQFYFVQGLQSALLPVLTAGLFALGMTFATPRTVLEGRRLATFFSLALTAGIPVAIGALVSDVATLVHPATSYVSVAQLIGAVPDTLAVFAPNGTVAEQVFLGSVDLFSIWSYIVIAYGYAALTKSSLARALVVAFACGFAVTFGLSLR